jgi:hypothetical protein
MGAALTFARRYALFTALLTRTTWMRPIFVATLTRQRRQLTNVRSSRDTDNLECPRESPAMDSVATACMDSSPSKVRRS